MSLEDNWNDWEHEIVEQPTAKARINEEGEIIIEVYLKMKHWIGNKKLARLCLHGMGFKLSLKNMWLLAEKCPVPLRWCKGQFCGHKNCEEDSDERDMDPAKFICPKCKKIAPYYRCEKCGIVDGRAYDYRFCPAD